MSVDVKNTEWPVDEVKRLAAETGKPLEVTVAQAFLAKGWTARFNSYFDDVEGRPPRELDVLAERHYPLEDGAVSRTRALVSCRAFPLGRSPFAYTLSARCMTPTTPRFVSSFRSRRAVAATGGNTYGVIPELESSAAQGLLASLDLNGKNEVVAFDVHERAFRMKDGEPIGAPFFKRVKDGDDALFGAVDSGMKAAVHWKQEDLQRQQPVHFAALNIPVCVLGLPMWTAAIDDGKIGEPTVAHGGFTTVSYPITRNTTDVTALLWAATEIGRLVDAVDGLARWFHKEVYDLDIWRSP